MKESEKEEESKTRENEGVVQNGLSASFYSILVNQPVCITDGYCNGCGRCQH